MLSEKDWDIINKERGWRLGEFGIGALRFTLLFGSAAVALALILTPMLDRTTRVAQNYPYNIDGTTTGSIGYNGIYTIQRSVLQASPDAVCVIRSNGQRNGNC